MREPTVAAGLPLEAQLAACVAALLELEPDELPADTLNLQGRLAAGNLRLIAAETAGGEVSPAYWIALLGDAGSLREDAGSPREDAGSLREDAGSLRENGGWAVMFDESPVWAPVAIPAAARPVAAYVLAPLDPALPLAAPGGTAGEGRVEALFTAPAAEAATVAHERLRAEPGRGLEGDRYFEGTGTFSASERHGQDLTLVEAEVLEALALSGADSRRNVVTRGIDLNALVGRRFRIGEVECAGRRLCEPCSHLQRLTRPGILRALVHRGGLRADVVAGGEVRVGDEVVALEGGEVRVVARD